MANIREWMEGKTILLTGGAGFFGKVLTEKLLSNCPGLERIYVIIRSKRGTDAKERWSEIIKDKLFEKLLMDHPGIIDKKIVILNGDMSLINLGLSEDILKQLKNEVNIVFHSAATVRFDDPLHKAFLTNTRGTLEMCKLALEMKHLKCFVYVSTAFCNFHLDLPLYEEKIYDPGQDWETVLKLMESENPFLLNTISKKILGSHPNTYTFSKTLSEKIVEKYSTNYPTVIARPSVVVGIYKSPLPGWIDNLNGVIGVTTGVCKGAIRIILGKKKAHIGYIPVDFAVNALIVSAWEKAESENKELAIYNCDYGKVYKIDFEYIATKGLAINHEVALDNDVWYPFLMFTANSLYFHFLFYLLHVFPACIIDSLLLLFGKKPILIKLNIKIYKAMQALSAFTQKNVSFENTNYMELWSKLRDDETDLFYLAPPPESNIYDVMKCMHYGVKVYFFKENYEDNEYHQLKLKRFYYLDRFTRVVLASGLSMFIYKSIMNIFFT